MYQVEYTQTLNTIQSILHGMGELERGLSTC